jgi:outer membrane protein OmpA-like peptidoglycan-associated protein
VRAKLWFSSILILLGGGLIFAQQPDPNQQRSSPAEQVDHTPIFRVNVVSRTTKAVNYRHHSGKTDLDFAGTTLMPQARGLAKVESRTGRIEINAGFDNLEAPRTFGPEYLTYVLWAITPEGRASNLGEIVPHDGKNSVRVSTDLQAFGLIVTAEPYFAVTRPSDLVVIENIVKPSTKGWEEPIDTKFDLLERGQYTIDANPAQLPATSADPNTPTDLLEARNAVAIAQAQQAESQAQQARLTAQQAEQARLQTQQEALQTRQRLLEQLNQVLQTRETARGLIVDMPDVLFDTDQHTLKPGARERLAKVAGILLAYPDLNVTVEGHTENLGGVEYNQHSPNNAKQRTGIPYKAGSTAREHPVARLRDDSACGI